MNYFSSAARLIDGLRSRDRRAIIIGFGIVVAVLAFILVESRWQSYIDMRQVLSDRKADVEWIGKQAPIIKNLQTGCTRGVIDGMASREFVTMLVRRNQLQLGQLEFVGDSIALTVLSSNPNDILRLMEQIACGGLMLNQLNIEKVSKFSESLNYRADLDLRAEPSL
ncbi:MAG: hypothetical protein CMK43_07205 [Porticoccaceae bacterium]|nr:hypothetical protein [Porticoccaceae bacterium]